MKQGLGILIWLGAVISVVAVLPLIASIWNASLRPSYVSRGVLTETAARIRHLRVRHHDFAYFEMDCGDDDLREVTVLDLPEFEENAREFVARSHPECRNIRYRRMLPFNGSWLLP